MVRVSPETFPVEDLNTVRLGQIEIPQRKFPGEGGSLVTRYCLVYRNTRLAPDPKSCRTGNTSLTKCVYIYSQNPVERESTDSSKRQIKYRNTKKWIFHDKNMVIPVT